MVPHRTPNCHHVRSLRMTARESPSIGWPIQQAVLVVAATTLPVATEPVTRRDPGERSTDRRSDAKVQQHLHGLGAVTGQLESLTRLRQCK